jgi:hypothetical protein
MSTIVTRAGKGSALSFAEVDGNFTNLNTDKVEGQSSSVDSEIALFSGTGGKTIKRATTTGVLKASSGVIEAAVAGTDYAAPGSATTFTVAQTFRAANAIRSEAASTQDAVVIAGRAGGTGSFALTLTPTTLSANRTVTIPDAGGNYTLGYLNVPQSGSDKTSSYTLATTDIGEFVGVGSGGSITIPDATFAAGDIVSVFNNTTGNITITCSITTAYIAGTNTDKDTMTLATRGVATILFISGTVCVVTGNVS